ncbi:hypothetical protein [Moorella sulfitireducens (nom. illeg.)]|uniref:hypothetical protein n=1 Tax=Neomoorella sulfitireducens TaxID=2972948 RepID=UPI0021AC6C0D|nr:hypothetical protein [Moorella sulfitireducens]
MQLGIIIPVWPAQVRVSGAAGFSLACAWLIQAIAAREKQKWNKGRASRLFNK